MAAPLTKSYVCTNSLEDPYRNDLVIYPMFEEARRSGWVSEIVNYENGERMKTTQVLDKAEEYAKGLLALGLVPGVDTLMVIGCPTLEAVCLYAAAIAIGVAYAQPFVHKPREKSIVLTANLVNPKVLICGEGSGGLTFTAMTSLFDEMSDRPSSAKLPFVEHLFYDDTYKSRSPTQKYIKTLDRLRELGDSVTDEQLEEAKRSVKPEFTFLYLFTSGSTGVPKCVVHTHQSYAYMQKEIIRLKNMTTISLNINSDSMVCYSNIQPALAGIYGKVVMAPEKADERSWADMGRIFSKAIMEESVHIVSLTTASLQALVRDIQKHQTVLSSVIMVFFGGQVISAKFREDGRECFKSSMQVIGYGMSELRSIGFALVPPSSPVDEAITFYASKNSEVRLADANDEVVDIGIDGEVQVKAGCCFKEYANEPEKTKEMFTADGFLKTGDSAVMYPDGGILVKGRLADCLRFKVFNNVEYPGPIENILTKHSDIAEALVVAGRCNDWLGDEVTYCLRMMPGKTRPSESELLEFCLQNGMTSDRQRPARIIYFDSFPYTDNGRKVSKKSVKEKVGEMIAEDEAVGKCQWFRDLENPATTGVEGDKDHNS